MSESETFGQKIEALLRTNYPKKLRYFYHRPLLAAGGYLVVSTAIETTLALIFGGFSGNPDVVDLTEHDGLGFLHIFMSLAIYYYFMLPTWLGSTFDELHNRQIFNAPKIKSETQIEAFIGSRWLYWLPYALISCVAIVPVINVFIAPLEMWFELHPIIFVLVVLTWMVGWYGVASLLVHLALSVFLIYRIFRENKITVFPLEADRCGGFSPLGRFSLRLVTPVFVYGFMLIAWAVGSIQNDTISSDYGLLISIGSYLIIVPTLFYLPLHSAHKAMVAFRDKLINETSSRYSQEHLAIHDEQLDTDALKAKLEKMDALKQLEEHERDYPVWPFNVGIRLAVILNAITPLAMTVIGVAVDAILS